MWKQEENLVNNIQEFWDNWGTVRVIYPGFFIIAGGLIELVAFDRWHRTKTAVKESRRIRAQI